MKKEYNRYYTDSNAYQYRTNGNAVIKPERIEPQRQPEQRPKRQVQRPKKSKDALTARYLFKYVIIGAIIAISAGIMLLNQNANIMQQRVALNNEIEQAQIIRENIAELELANQNFDAKHPELKDISMEQLSSSKVTVVEVIKLPTQAEAVNKPGLLDALVNFFDIFRGR